MRTSFVHLADTGLGYRDENDPAVFGQVAKQFRYAVEFAVEQRASFVVSSGNLFHAPEIEPDAFQVVYRGLRSLADKNISAIAIRGRREIRLQPGIMSWYEMLAQEGLLAVLQPENEESQLTLRRWDRRTGRGCYADLGRCRVFGMQYFGSMSGLFLQALAKSIASEDNREMDYRVVLLHGTLEHFSQAVGPRLSYSDVLMLRRHTDYVALGGCDDTYEAEDWVYNPGPNGFYHVTVDTAVQPKQHARYVAYPSALEVSRPAATRLSPGRREVEEAIFEQLVTAAGDEHAGQPQRDALRLVTQSMWGSGDVAALQRMLVELAERRPQDKHAA